MEAELKSLKENQQESKQYKGKFNNKNRNNKQSGGHYTGKDGTNDQHLNQ